MYHIFCVVAMIAASVSIFSLAAIVVVMSINLIKDIIKNF